jgi:hypothetical protein
MRRTGIARVWRSPTKSSVQKRGVHGPEPVGGFPGSFGVQRDVELREGGESTMKRLMAVMALGIAIVFGTGIAYANQCPLLIKQLNDGIAKMSDKGKADEAKKLVAEAQKLHDSGKHAESIAKCEEAAKVAGVTLEKKKS